MSDSITLGLDSEVFRRNIRRLTDVEVGKAMALALNKTAFEILEAEKLAVKMSFPSATPRGVGFLSGRGSFVFDAAAPVSLNVFIYPRRKTEQILIDHVEGGTILPTRERLIFGKFLAVPIREARLRGRSGRVPKRLLPSSLLGGKGRGFRAGKVIFERRGGTPRGAKRRGTTPSRMVPLYALVPTADLKPAFDFHGVARKVAIYQWPLKARRAFEKILIARSR